MKDLIEDTIISAIRPYTEDFRVWDKETDKWKKGKELNITDATSVILSSIEELNKRPVK